MIKKSIPVVLVLTLVALFFSAASYAQVKSKSKIKTPAGKTKTVVKSTKKPDKATRIMIRTDSGIMIVKLYDSTPLHRDNFIKLVKQKFYDSLLFHRIIPEFMIQGGDPQSKHAAAGSMLGNGGSDMKRIPAEFRSTLIHKKGALAAARDGNPEKASSACQFYLVEGRKVTDEELNMVEKRKGIKYTPGQRNIYRTQGGTPLLDQDYTVFGEIESGMEVVSKIINVPRDRNDRPLGDIHMYMEVVK